MASSDPVRIVIACTSLSYHCFVSSSKGFGISSRMGFRAVGNSGLFRVSLNGVLFLAPVECMAP